MGSHLPPVEHKRNQQQITPLQSRWCQTACRATNGHTPRIFTGVPALVNNIKHIQTKDLFEKVSKDIVAAMKAKDKVRLEALRNIKKYFIEAKTQPGANDTLTDEAALKILSKLAKQGRDTAALYVSQNREDLAAEEAAQAAVIEEYLPKALTPEEVEAEVKAIIAEVGATSPKDMGKVMGVASKKLAGRADGKAISEVTKRLLAQ